MHTTSSLQQRVGVGLVVSFSLFAATSCGTLRPQSAGGVVSSGTPGATAAGVEILERGGNSIDAAVAVSFALAVTEPAGSGIGGQTIMLVHPRGQSPFVVNGTSFAPISLPASISRDDLTGHRATTVPSTVRVLEFAWRNHGSGRVSWSELLQPAIRLAEDGFRLGHFRQRSLARYAHALRRDPVVAKLFLRPDGKPLRTGDVIRQPELARTLRRLAEAGADDFYNGEIAGKIVEDMRANGGWITRDDLARFPEPRVVPPLHTEYRGRDVYSLPPPTGGWVVLQALNILEHAPPEELRGDAPERLVWLAEALRVTHGNRLQTPIEDLLEYDSQTDRKLDRETAEKLMTIVDRPGAAETTHFSVVDRDGMGVGVTASLNAYFGARTASPELGFLYNDYMHEFELGQPEHPFALKPGAMPYSSMSATIVATDGEVDLVLGSPGSKRIISAVIQVASHWIDVGNGVEEAVAAPRLHVVPDDDLFIEGRRVRIPARVLLDLELRGYSLLRPISSLYKEHLNPYFGGVHAVARENGEWTGAADPRRDGVVGRARSR